MIHGVLQPDGKLFVDNTILSAEAKCQLSAHTRFALGHESLDESITLESGRAIHKVLETVFKGGTVGDAMMVLSQVYEDRWKDIDWLMETGLRLGMSAEDLQKDRRSYENVKKVVSTWLRNNPPSAWPFQVDTATVEATFQVLLDAEENIWYTGTPDVGRVRTPSGNYALDHKSTGRITRDWKNGFRTSGQVSGYLWGLEQATGHQYIGMFINGIELAKVPGSTRKCSEHGTPYAECGELHVKHELWPVQRSPQQLEHWRVNAIKLARRYKDRLILAKPVAEVPTEGEFNGSCAYCTNAEWCATGRQEDQLAIRFTQRWWDPQERK